MGIQVTKQHRFLRITLSAVAASMLAASLVSCATPSEEPAHSSAENTANSSEQADSSSQADGLDCNWDDARLLVADYSLPSDQQGDLAETLVGHWQFTHYDLGLGGGWEPWADEEDRRYVYGDTGELMHCVISGTGGSPSALGAKYSVTGDQITLDNGNGATAVAWTKDVLLLSNHFDDSMELFHRR